MLNVSLNSVGCIVPPPDLCKWLTAAGEDVSRFNKVCWPAGASKYAEGHFLLTQASMNALAGAGLANPITVTLQDDQISGSAGTVILDRMFLIEARPVHRRLLVQSPANIDDGIYDCKLVDERWYWQFVFSGFNSLANGNVSANLDRSLYYYATTPRTDGTAATWDQLVTAVLTDLGIADITAVTLAPSSTGSFNPVDYLLDSEPANVTLDRICAALGVVFTATWSPSGARYFIQTPDSYNAAAAVLNGPTQSTVPAHNLIGGHEIYAPADATGQAWLNAIVPAQVTVLFPRQYNPLSVDVPENLVGPTTPQPISQFYTLTSTAGKPSGVTGIAGANVVIHDSTWTIDMTTGNATNATTLQARADYLAARYYNRFKVNKVNALLRGINNLGPFPGTIEWALTPDAVYTRFRIEDDWYAYGGNRDVVAGFKDKRVIGLGNVQTYKTFDGSLAVIGPRTMVRSGKILSDWNGTDFFVAVHPSNVNNDISATPVTVVDVQLVYPQSVSPDSLATINADFLVTGAHITYLDLGYTDPDTGHPQGVALAIPMGKAVKGDEVWTHYDGTTGILGHIALGTATGTTNSVLAFGASVVGGNTIVSLTPVGVSTDLNRHVTAIASTTPLTANLGNLSGNLPIFADEIWIHIDTTDPTKVVIDHIGPDATSLTTYILVDPDYDTENAITLDLNRIKVDAKGHVVVETDSPIQINTDGIWLGVVPGSGETARDCTVVHLPAYAGSDDLPNHEVDPFGIFGWSDSLKQFELSKFPMVFDYNGHEYALDEEETIGYDATAVTNITQARLDSDGNLQIKTQVQYIFQAETESDWQTVSGWAITTECPS